MSRILRRIGAITLAITIGLTAFIGAIIGGLTQTGASAAAPSVLTQPASPATSDGKLVVAIVLGRSGSDAADMLAPYEVFGSSDEFAVYTYAETTKPAPLDGGIWVNPDYAFAEVAAGDAPHPDLVVVPAVNIPGQPEEQAARAFIKDAYDAGAHILGICAGSRMLAASGILDGLTATSHWSRLAALKESNPEVHWISGQRYVQDGRVTTTGGVTSSIPGSLRVMADLAGDTEAAGVGNAIAYPGWSLTGPTAMPAHRFGIDDAGVLVNAAFPWARPTINIELTDGIGELDAAALFEVYTYSQSATTRAVSPTGTVRTRHGLILSTELRGDQNAIQAANLPSTSGYGGLDAAFEQLATTSSPDVVNSVAKMLEYPVDRVSHDISADAHQWRSPALLTLALLLATALGLGPTLIRRLIRRQTPAPLRHGRPQAEPPPARTGGPSTETSRRDAS